MERMPLTAQNVAAWEAMVQTGMDQKYAWEYLADWASMLEKRLAELDPTYAAYPWGRTSIGKPDGYVSYPV